MGKGAGPFKGLPDPPPNKESKNYREKRLIADTTARRVAVTIELCTPTPYRVRSPIAHST